MKREIFLMKKGDFFTTCSLSGPFLIMFCLMHHGSSNSPFVYRVISKVMLMIFCAS